MDFRVPPRTIWGIGVSNPRQRTFKSAKNSDGILGFLTSANGLSGPRQAQ
ncbi:Hypothetical protein FKW44_010644 [Caligus rogercresseyi]|uniref:Uncharacterized protein n=1 Tax=Caligus rogercresseyi TaxID=217165 RepID=A0A7T8HGW4_CALRO|nr:Hypothetical protein FKW44_010644 [Caligus rogercresseyi]